MTLKLQAILLALSLCKGLAERDIEQPIAVELSSKGSAHGVHQKHHKRNRHEEGGSLAARNLTSSFIIHSTEVQTGQCTANRMMTRTKGTCGTFHCGKNAFGFGSIQKMIAARGEGVMCVQHDKSHPKTCDCPPGFCVSVDGKKCEIDRDSLAPSMSNLPASEIVKYGAGRTLDGEDIDLAKLKLCGINKIVGKCSTFMCDHSRDPDRSGMGCNGLDEKCYCTAPGYYATKDFQTTSAADGNKCLPLEEVIKLREAEGKCTLAGTGSSGSGSTFSDPGSV